MTWYDQSDLSVQSSAPSNRLICCKTSLGGLRIVLWWWSWLPWFCRINKNNPSIQKLCIHSFSSFLSFFYGGIWNEAKPLWSSRVSVNNDFRCKSYTVLAKWDFRNKRVMQLKEVVLPSTSWPNGENAFLSPSSVVSLDKPVCQQKYHTWLTISLGEVVLSLEVVLRNLHIVIV